MHSDNYRKLQEERFSNNTGASFAEILSLSQLPFSFIFFSFIVVSKFRKSTSFITSTLEFTFIFIPLILSLTILSDYPSAICIFFYIVSCIGVFSFFILIRVPDIRIALKYVILKDSRLPCITSYRSIVNSFSVICILAADFKCFPEKYLKTSDHGYGLMDIGVGLYVISNAFTNSHFTKDNCAKHVKIIPFLRSTLKKTLPLLLIGVGRYFITTAVQYHQNISEYGVHWNFFISLSVLATLNEFLILFVNRIKTTCVITVILLVLHEYVLYAGVKSWINDDFSRVGFLASNKEGICSLLGYEVIYLCGLVVKHILPRNGDNLEKYFSVVKKLILGFLVCTILTLASEYAIGVSRKLANCGYIFWTISICLISLANAIMHELFLYALNIPVLKDRKQVEVVPSTIEAINYNGLIFFLAGNLLTGIINISIPTLTIGSTNSVLILILYMFSCCYLVLYLRRKNIRLR